MNIGTPLITLAADNHGRKCKVDQRIDSRNKTIKCNCPKQEPPSNTATITENSLFKWKYETKGKDQVLFWRQ